MDELTGAALEPLIRSQLSSDPVGTAPAPLSYMINVAAYRHGVGTGDSWLRINGFSEAIVSYNWNAGKIPVLFAHPASAGHGLNLQDGGNILAFFGHWWDLEQYQQIIERIGPTRQAQAGHDRPVFIHHIVAADTMDELVMARRESKREVQDLLLEAMKRKGKS